MVSTKRSSFCLVRVIERVRRRFFFKKKKKLQGHTDIYEEEYLKFYEIVSLVAKGPMPLPLSSGETNRS